MKNITKESIRKDYEVLREMFQKYSNAVYENQEGQPAHFDNQTKFVRITIGDVRCGLSLASNALRWLCSNENDIIED